MSYQETFEDFGRRLPSLPEKQTREIQDKLVDVETEETMEDYEEVVSTTGFLPKCFVLEIGDETLTVPKGWYVEVQSPWSDGANLSGPFKSRSQAKWSY